MQPLLYALNIGTLATWLTVSGASTVAVAIKIHERLPKLNEPKADEIEMAITEEIMGSAPPAAPEDAAVTEEIQQQEVVPEEIVPEVPEMPEIPEIAEMEPLPDIPDLPATPDGELKPKPQPAAPKKSEQPKQASRTATTNRGGASGQGTGEGAGTAKGSGNAATGSARWAGLRKVEPNYPSACRRAGQTGSVSVVFTVDERGYVVNARVSAPCPYAELNEAALASVRRYKATPGPRATNTQVVRFKLNN
ncbi:energy transducer TonB [Haloferula sp. BvORR071]|uniref:energy transducer TonB n=1 Tax=Haloferula sp. BvORR071 TaxID=1396141 RepID=UPI000698713C|nr:energy transducer TonB [Haloferula sp. BvORR071]